LLSDYIFEELINRICFLFEMDKRFIIPNLKEVILISLHHENYNRHILY
jgi:hypothetical protein